MLLDAAIEASLDARRALPAALEASEAAWERLHSRPWHAVPDARRHGYAAAASLVAAAWLGRERPEKALEALDKGLVLGGPRLALQRACSAVHALLPPAGPLPSGWGSAAPAVRGPARDPGEVEVPRVARPELSWFRDRCMRAARPCVLTDCQGAWRAREGDAEVERWLGLMGWRTVPVEVGQDYLSEQWTQRLMKFKDFVADYLGTGQPAYFAQHELFEQVPELAGDFVAPDYCALSLDAGDFPDPVPVATNVWLGPAGTVSRCHFDPKHNLLSQVSGRKLVKLVAPAFSEGMCPVSASPNGRFANTSRIYDLEAPRAAIEREHPEFARVTEVWSCVLEPGEMLYIPPGYWHYVRALDRSLSVSFWW